MDVHESPPPSTAVISKKPRRRLIYLTTGVVLWYAIAFTLMEAFAKGDSFIHGKAAGIYWFELYPPKALTAAIIPPTVAIIAAHLIPNFLTTKYGSLPLIGITIILLIVLCLAMAGQAVGQARSHFIYGANAYNHIQTLRYGNHTYHLADKIEDTKLLRHACWQRADDPDCIEAEFTHVYLVYQCGRLGIMCHNIGYEAFDERIHMSDGELSVNAVGSIILEVDGRWVWTYPDG